uniref:Uncharacterized protein n=1 Tax=Solanum lycopersicum TaxID=4081 RepID=A0A3Q7FZ21_SOLLC
MGACFGYALLCCWDCLQFDYDWASYFLSFFFSLLTKKRFSALETFLKQFKHLNGLRHQMEASFLEMFRELWMQERIEDIGKVIRREQLEDGCIFLVIT